MNLAVPRAAGNALDGADKIGRELERPRPDNRSRKRPRPALFAVGIKNVGNFFFRIRVQDAGSRQRLRAIHSHVERPFTHERKSSRWIVHHHGGDADIGQHSVAVQESLLCRHLRDIPEIRMHQDHSRPK